MTKKYGATAASLMALCFASTAVASGFGSSSSQAPMPGFGGPGMSFPGSGGPWGATSNAPQAGAAPTSQGYSQPSYPKYAPSPPPQARESAPVLPPTYGEQPYAPPADAYPPAQGAYPPPRQAREAGPVPPAAYGEQPRYAPPADAYPPASGAYPPPRQAREAGPVPPAAYGEQPRYAPPAGAYPPAQWAQPPAQWAYPPPREPARFPPSAAPYPVAPGVAPPDPGAAAPPSGAYPPPSGGYGNSPGYPSRGQPSADVRNEDGKDKGGFNPGNMMNKMPNPMNMFGGSKN